MVDSSELVTYMRLPSPVTCIMFGDTPATTVSWRRGRLGVDTFHAWISLFIKQETQRYRSSGDCRRSAGRQPLPGSATFFVDNFPPLPWAESQTVARSARR